MKTEVFTCDRCGVIVEGSSHLYDVPMSYKFGDNREVCYACKKVWDTLVGDYWANQGVSC